MHWENYISISFHIEWDMIVVRVFLPILNQMESPIGSKSNGKLSPRTYPIQCERKWKHSFLSARNSVKNGPRNMDLGVFWAQGILWRASLTSFSLYISFLWRNSFEENNFKNLCCDLWNKFELLCFRLYIRLTFLSMRIFISSLYKFIGSM